MTLIEAQQCGPNQIINSTTKSCQCKDKFILNPNNRKCELSCNVNGILLPSGICRCLEGFKNVNGFCHNCTAPGQMIDFINLSCKCMTPQFYRANNG